MKKIEFKTIHTTITAAKDQCRLCGTVLQEGDLVKLDYRDTLQSFLGSVEWQQKKPMVDGKDIDLVLKVNEAVESADEEVIVEDDVAAYLCEAVALQKFNPGAKRELLLAIRQYKEDFVAVGKATSKSFKQLTSKSKAQA